MGTTAKHTGARFKVACSWCGAVISLDAPKDAERMCADCFRA